MKKCLITFAVVLVAVAIFIACQSQPVQYTVSFEPNGGSYVASQMLYSGQKATKPENPTKSGYVFVAWYADKDLTSVYDFDTVVTSNVTLYAKWVEKGELVTTGSSVPEVVDNKLGNELVVYEVAPLAGEDTSANVPAGVAEDGYSLILNVTALSTTVSEVIEIGNIEAGIELELVATNGTERTVLTDFGGKAITVTTYVAKGYLDGLKVIYNGVGTNPIASSTYDDGTVDIYANDAEMGEQLGYSTESGMLRFSTTHFSEFLLIYIGAEDPDSLIFNAYTPDKDGEKSLADLTLSFADGKVLGGGTMNILESSLPDGGGNEYVDVALIISGTYGIDSDGLRIDATYDYGTYGKKNAVLRVLKSRDVESGFLKSFDALENSDVFYLYDEDTGCFNNGLFVRNGVEVVGCNAYINMTDDSYECVRVEIGDAIVVLPSEVPPYMVVYSDKDCSTRYDLTKSIEEDEELYGKGNRVGGRIFYVHDNNGAAYQFFTEDGTEITAAQTVTNLANAYWYTVNGEPTADKFYVCNANLGIGGIVYGMQWGSYGIDVGSGSWSEDWSKETGLILIPGDNNTAPRLNGVGQGKVNTAAVLSYNGESPTPFESLEGESGYGDNTIWYWLVNEVNAKSFNGCNDWFIPCVTEIQKLESSGVFKVPEWCFIWSSCESNNEYAKGRYFDGEYPEGAIMGNCKYSECWYSENCPTTTIAVRAF